MIDFEWWHSLNEQLAKATKPEAEQVLMWALEWLVWKENPTIVAHNTPNEDYLYHADCSCPACEAVLTAMYGMNWRFHKYNVEEVTTP